MKPHILVICLALLGPATWAAADAPIDTPANTAASPGDEVPGPSPQVQRWADRCTDFTTNGWAFKAPANFLPWLEVFSEPGIWLEFAHRGLDPQTYVRTADSLLEPDMVKNYLEWTDPIIYEKWANALAEPQFVTAINATLFDPGKFMRWVMLPLDPKPWNILLTAANPETWGKWLTAPLDPRTQALFNKAADPNTLLRLIQAWEDPNNFPGLTVFQPASASSYGTTSPATLRN